MVPLKRLPLEHDGHQNGEYSKRYHFLDYLQLHKVERASVFRVAYPVGGNLCAVFEECHSP